MRNLKPINKLLTNQQDVPLKVLQSNNGGEFKSGNFQTYAKTMGLNNDLPSLIHLNTIQGLNDETSCIWMPLVACSPLQTFPEHIGKRPFQPLVIYLIEHIVDQLGQLHFPCGLERIQIMKI